MRGKVKIGVLKFGTVSWLLDTIQANGLDKAEGIELDIVPLASTQATTVGLQGGSVDVIATDWLWVSRERAEGGDSPSRRSPPRSARSWFPPILPSRRSAISRARSSAWREALSTRAGSARGLCAAHRQYRLENGDHAGIRRASASCRAGQAGRDRCRAQFLALRRKARGRGLHAADRLEDVVRELGAKGEVAMVGFAFSEGWATKNLEGIRHFCAPRPRPTSCSRRRTRNGTG